MAPQTQLRDPVTGEARMLEIDTSDDSLSIKTGDGSAPLSQLASPVQVFTAATLTPIQGTPSSVFTGTLVPMAAGDWLMTFTCSWRNTAISQSVLGEWVWDGAAAYRFLRQEAKDSNVNNRIPAVWRTVLTVAEGATPVFDVLLGTTGSSTVSGYDLVASFEKIS